MTSYETGNDDIIYLFANYHDTMRCLAPEDTIFKSYHINITLRSNDFMTFELTSVDIFLRPVRAQNSIITFCINSEKFSLYDSTCL